MKARNQSSAEERKGKRMRIEGRVKPWSWTSSGSTSGLVFVARESRSLFFNTRRRILVSKK